MDGPPAQSLGVEPVHGAIVKRAPRKAGDPVISPRLMFRVLTSGALIVIGTLWVFSLGITQVWNAVVFAPDVAGFAARDNIVERGGHLGCANGSSITSDYEP